MDRRGHRYRVGVEYEQPGADFTLIKQRATQEGMNPDEVVRDVVARYFEEEDRFVEAAKRGRHLPRRAGLALSC
jgi:hypothetical protein